jgi:hypothetical protein
MTRTNKILFAALTVATLAVACSGRISKREEACQKTSDCDTNLVCVAITNVGGVCRPVDYNLTPSNKECAAVQCATPDDCCTNFVPPNQCPLWDQQCMQDPQMFMTSCTNFMKFCMCDATKYACLMDKCVTSSSCMMDTDCFNPTPHCVSGQCQQCAQNTDCPNKGVCYGGKCTAGCTTDADCPIFYGCKSGSCQKTGCISDRECIVYEQSPLGFCDMATKECSTKCDKDVQCNTTGSRALRICDGGKCVSAGCETDEECKAVLNPAPGTKAVCRIPPKM